jgi:hypothetical protein
MRIIQILIQKGVIENSKKVKNNGLREREKAAKKHEEAFKSIVIEQFLCKINDRVLFTNTVLFRSYLQCIKTDFILSFIFRQSVQSSLSCF